MKQSPAAVSTATEPGSLLSQYKLLCAVIDAPWATRLDMKIASHVIERYFARHGNARASLRFLEQATSATRPNVIESLRRIVDQGVFSIIRQGIGTRPTEYGLNFDFAKNNNLFAKNKKPNQPSDSGTLRDTSSNSSGTPDNTASGGSSGIVGDTSTSGIVDKTSCGIADDTSNGSSGIVHDTESYLRNTPTGVLTVSRNEDTHATASPPPVGGPEATTAGMARDPEKVADPFEELWTVYPRKHHRAKARAAYKALSPSPDLHADLVAKAIALAAHYDTTATEKKWWKHMHTWLAGECYLEDLPVPYENPKEAAIARAKENGPRKANMSRPAGKDTGLSSGTPIGRHTVKIVGSEITGDIYSEERKFIFSYRIENGDREGTEFSHAFKYVSRDEETQFEGQSIYAQLRNATGVLEPEDTSDFHDKTLLAVVKPMGRIEYASL